MLLSFFSLLFFACHLVKLVEVPRDEFFTTSIDKKEIEGYDVYVHTNQASFKLTNVEIDSSGISGVASRIDDTQAGLIKLPDGRKQRKKHQYDINLHTEKQIADEVASESKAAAEPRIRLNKSDITKVERFARDRKGDFGGVALVILLIVAILGVLALIFAIVRGVNESSNASSNSSNDSSNDSSNSSDSGGSDSNSDSGNSSDASACYVATMVYGSYDAPEVMVLRQFRDNILSKSAAGQSFINWYYANSPSWVERWKSKKLLNSIIRFVLNRFVGFLKWIF